MRICLITFLILTIIPFSHALGEKEDSTLLFKQELEIVKQPSINKDSFPVVNLEQESKSQKRGMFRGVATFRFGRHDNFTKSKSTTYPRLKTGSSYFSLYAEVGMYKFAYFSLVWGGMFPLSGKKVVRDTLHKTDLTHLGLTIQLPLFSRESKVNVAPLVGYKYLSEDGVIDPKGNDPAILNKHYVEYGPTFGLSGSYRLFKWSWRELRILPEFTREDLKRASVNRFRVNLAYIEVYFSKAVKTEAEKKQGYDQFELLLGIDFANWSDGRKERFFTFSIAFDGPW